MPPYRVMIVDDSAFMRKVISDLISEHPDFQIVYTAKNGRDAVDAVRIIKPDVITMDVEMPEMNGLEAVKKIMEENPTPIVMLSSLTEEGARETILALELGAVDFVTKPSGSISLDLYKARQLLTEKLEIAIKTKVRRSAAVLPSNIFALKKEEHRHKLSNLSNKDKSFIHLVAVGTSTGGPRALQQLITSIPEQFPAPILIVQHMPPNFTRSLAQRLDSQARIKVVEAEDECPVQSGTAYIAPGGWHMTMVKGTPVEYRIRLSKEEPRAGHRPSVDVMYESLLPFRELRRHIVIMTGMGSDGAKGMKALQAAGAYSTIAESEQTCVVYGMPRAAIESNCVQCVLPVHEIPLKLIDLVCD